jgi:uncharacterized protein (TIGR00369 family)
MNDPFRPRGGFADLTGYELGEWREGYAEVHLSVDGRHLNRSGVAHGGVLATLIDTACGYAGNYSADPERARRSLTLSMTTQFIAPAREGARLTAAARLSGGGRQLFFAACEVRDQDGHLVARGDGVFKYRRDSRPDGA